MTRVASILVLSMLLAGCVGDVDPDVLANAKRVSLDDPQRAMLASAVKETLKDPDSAQFRWHDLILVKGTNDFYDYCFKVNAKNSYGGYTGFTDVYVIFRLANERLNDVKVVGMDNTDDVYTRICDGKGYAGGFAEASR